MMLCFDIGNTNIVVGVFEGKKLLGEFRLKSDQRTTTDEYSSLLLTLIAQRLPKGAAFSSCIISSVVPPLTPLMAKIAKDNFDIDALVVGPGIKTGLAIKVAEPSAVGADRIVNAVAVRELYGLPALVVDFGTATSFDYVSAEGVYEGGAIAPGAAIALDALVKNTAKLPRIELRWPKSIIGKDTISAMQSGSVVGYLCLVDGIIERIEREAGAIPHVISTGGLGAVFAEHSKKVMKHDPHLTLEGLRVICDLN